MKDDTDTATLDIEHDVLGMHRRDDHETSVKAAKGVRRFTLRETVAEFARDCERTGFIDDDLKAYWPQKPESSLRKRRTELAQENVVVETGLTRVNRAGQDEKVWVHRDYHPSPPEIVERDTSPKASKVARLEAKAALLDELLTLALPYVETAQDDPLYKGGSVAPLVRRIRAAIEAN